MTRPSIAVVAHNAYGPMAGSTSGHIGGVEWQTSLTARWLAREGYPVSLVTWADGPEGDETLDGVRVVKVCRRDAGVPGLRFLHPRWTSLDRALARADADVYYQNCGEYVTGQVALFCRLHGRRFVFSAASDQDCDGRLPGLPKRRERVLYRYGIARADAVVVQTESQRRRLREGFGRDATVLPMPCPGPDEAAYPAPAPPSLVSIDA